LAVDQHRIIESKLIYRLRNLLDLLFRVNTRISRVQLEIAWSQEGNLSLVKAVTRSPPSMWIRFRRPQSWRWKPLALMGKGE
jgi:hypothetical protein